MIQLCKYKHIFGKEKEGLHAYRILDIAVVDYIGTVLVAYILSVYYDIEFWKINTLLFVLAIIIHRIFCVNTTINVSIFGIL